jgi:hypothetical protein
MYKSMQGALLVLCLSGLTACSTPSDISQSAQKPTKAHQQRTHIYTEQVETLEKSKNLAHTLKQADLTREKQIEEASR